MRELEYCFDHARVYVWRCATLQIATDRQSATMGTDYIVHYACLSI